ncbi:ABC transporter permease [Arthrobacter crystallopoietes]|jgi:putative ABC transport system permease protein|uniref:Putative ABC transport system permease protein n=1 Tax=Crystallibacter crystallopoietes TaxID=37928 RepID=A0A1H1FLE5_9MICC|nr:ABC transporter permease [Arthrobacter crystallopoietes]AUI53030.1 ABC transporter permease [Arthrobacter crystallopoietes]SDR01710.1 putative ABC transport system permease protein [Arthrobacter crystallopoietes]
MIVAVELGLIYAIMALGVYLTFRILNFPDLTVDGSFTTGAAVASIMIINGYSPVVSTVAAFGAGLVAGWITGILHTKGKINGLLAGILTMIALYSINLRIMGRANLPLLREDTLITPLRDAGLLGTAMAVVVFSLFALAVKFVIDWFLHTDVGLAMQATGDNEEMIRSFGVSTDRMKILGLALSNGLVGLCGALIAQYQGFADIGMGIGLILAGLASVIIGQAIFGSRLIIIASLAVVLGSVLYRVVIQLALQAGLNPNDMKLISAVLVVIALVLPQWKLFKRIGGLANMRKSLTGAGAKG